MDLLFLTLVIGLPAAALLFGVWSIGNDFYLYFINRVNSRISMQKPLMKKYRHILNTYFAYYKLLSPQNKRYFERKLVRFMYSKKFIPRNFTQVSDEMKVLISATAVQLTFGLPEIYLTNFDKILVYPDEYYSRITKKYHLGEVNPRAGIIVLSWQAFVKGYASLTDSLNVGIHEMAHAIHFENRIMNSEYDFLDKAAVEKLTNITRVEMARINANPDTHFLRAYAGENEYEFFAVVLEYFFEQSTGLREHLPELYSTLVHLLNQDPIKLYNFRSVNV